MGPRNIEQNYKKKTTQSKKLKIRKKYTQKKLFSTSTYKYIKNVNMNVIP